MSDEKTTNQIERERLGYYLDPSEPELIRDWIEEHCYYTRDEVRGQRVKLLPWFYDEFLLQLFGVRNESGKHAYDRAILFVPKKQSKSFYLSCIACEFACSPRGAGNLCLICASNTKQAEAIFLQCVELIDINPKLDARFDIVSRNAKIIEDRKRHSRIQVISSQPHQSGFNAGLILCDEICEWGSFGRQVYAQLQKAHAARTNGKLICLTTANECGPDHFSVELIDYARKVKANELIDPHLLPVIYEVPQEKWQDENEWWRANPSIGHTVQKDFIRQAYRIVENNPREESNFKWQHCNIFASADKWISSTQWAACGDKSIREEDFYEAKRKGADYFIGLDGSRRKDLFCYSLLFPMDDLVYVFCRSFLPRKGIDEKSKADGFNYRQYSDWITLTDKKDDVDQDIVKQSILKDIQLFGCPKELRYDPYNCSILCQQIEDESRVDVVEVQTKGQIMSPAANEFERLIRTKSIRHNCNPILTWAVDNCSASENKWEQLIVSKGKSRGRVDPVFSIMYGIIPLVEAGTAAAKATDYI